MNIIKINDKSYNVIDGGVSVSETEANFTVELNGTIEDVAEDFSEVGDTITVLDTDGETSVAIYSNYSTLNWVRKNVADDTATIQLVKRPLEKRVAELENTIDLLTSETLDEA